MTVACRSSADARAVALDRRRAVADVAAGLAFGGRGGEQQLFVAEPAQQELMPGAAAAVTHQASDLGLMHRIDHGGRCAGAAERVTDVDDVGDAGALAAEFARHRNAEQPLGARSADRLFRKTRIAIDGGGVGRRDLGGLLGALHQVGRIGDAAACWRPPKSRASRYARRARPYRLPEPPLYGQSW